MPYEEVEIQDMAYRPLEGRYTYHCPCGDEFSITVDDLRNGEDIAVCPSCTLVIRVIYQMTDLP